MKKSLLLLCFGIAAVASFLGSRQPGTLSQTNIAPLAEGQQPTVEYVLAAIGAARELEVEDHARMYRYVEGNVAAEPFMTTEKVWRKTPERSFCHEKRVERLVDGSDSVTKRTLALGPKHAKHLWEEPRSTHATLETLHNAKKYQDIDVTAAIFSPTGDYWPRISKGNSTVRLDRATGHLLLIAKVSDRVSIEVTIDPAKGFVPVRIADRKDGVIVNLAEHGDWREVSKGLFLPFEWRIDSVGRTLFVSEVQTARANVELDEELLDFDFPPRVRVRDRSGWWNSLW